MAQLNVEIDDELMKQIKYACIYHKIKLKALVSAALESALGELGTTTEVIDEPGQEPISKAKRVEKS
jgi:hypothetical protein